MSLSVVPDHQTAAARVRVMFLFRAWDSKVSVSVLLLGWPSQLSHVLILVKANFFASFTMGIVVEKVITLGLEQALEFEFVEEVLKSRR